MRRGLPGCVLAVFLSLLLAGCTEGAEVPAAEQDRAEVVSEAAGAPSIAPQVVTPAEVLGTVSLSSPANGATRLDPGLVPLQWSTPTYSRAGAVQMRALLDGREACSFSSRTSCELRGLDTGRTYSWSVEARAPSGKTSVSVARTFRTDAPPTPPVPLSPAAGTHDTLEAATFRFAPSADPDGDLVRYSLELTDSAGRTSTTTCSVGECRTTLRLASEYSWRVVASDGVLSANSGTVHFRTDTPPTRPGIDAGDDGTVQLPRRIPFGATPSVDADRDPIVYTIEVRDPRGALVHSCTGLTTPACELVLPRWGETYTTQVIASDGLLTSATTLQFTTRVPIVFIHGYLGDSGTWNGLADILVAEDYPVLDFGAAAGVQTLVYDPGGKGIVHTAVNTVAARIESALLAAGYAKDQKVDVVAHSMGGLVSRVLVEKAGTTVDEGGRVTVPAKWASQPRTLTLLAVPNRGADDADICSGTGTWGNACAQMQPGSDFLRWLGTRAGTHSSKYVSVWGNADWVVDEESATLDDVDLVVLDRVCHAGSSGWGFFCDYPIVRAPGTIEVLGEVLAIKPGPS